MADSELYIGQKGTHETEYDSKIELEALVPGQGTQCGIEVLLRLNSCYF